MLQIAEIKYAKLMAEIHIESLSKSFLASLGVDFLTLLYEKLIDDKNIITIGVIKDGKLLGFIVAGESLRGVYLNLLKQPKKLIPTLVRGGISFMKLINMFEIGYYSFMEPKKFKQVKSNFLKAELYLLAVKNEARRLGIATQLFNHLQKLFYQDGINEFQVLVGSELFSAREFYIKMGAEQNFVIKYHGKPTFIFKNSIRYD